MFSVVYFYIFIHNIKKYFKLLICVRFSQKKLEAMRDVRMGYSEIATPPTQKDRSLKILKCERVISCKKNSKGFKCGSSKLKTQR